MKNSLTVSIITFVLTAPAFTLAASHTTFGSNATTWHHHARFGHSMNQGSSNNFGGQFQSNNFQNLFGQGQFPSSVGQQNGGQSGFMPQQAPHNQQFGPHNTQAPQGSQGQSAPQTVSNQASGTHNEQTIEQDIHAGINAERAKQSLSALSWNDTLATVALGHSTDMAQKNYFDHTDKSGCDPACRISHAGYAWTSVGENIYTETGYTLDDQQLADLVVQSWMNSPEHRKNVLDGNFTQEGVGITITGNSLYATEDFGQPR